ncbi:peptidoglycan DD-metalloendopeptidase family protein [Vibrio sp. ZSDE26]|uniref:Peptidoglycan DD-metalloendopeptidase family protein n=1 Tax=Vibrio amylolyticus TaxID=2847292 RepID=A0A9X2BJY9_9VIBR|nr:peptidoglycan DD-metalloendopeptidase family protein [Vibrio amylolyticus]MCK6265685.1 peptidoglycan DD-metalloendopeptidase family protein [Vibrio amylolyticus]
MTLFRYTLIAIALIAFSLAAVITLTSTPNNEVTDIKVTSYENQEQEPTQILNTSNIARIHYFVKVGDSLSTILSSWGITFEVTQKVLEADLESLKLDTIKPGDHLEFHLDGDSQQLVKLIYHESLVERAIYKKVKGGDYVYDFVEEAGEWKEKLISGTVHGSFSTSAHKLGLTTAQIANITRVLRDKVNFSRELRAGDRFNVLVKEQYLGSHLTGNTEIQGISISLRGKEVAAFLAEDGRFYDRDGDSLEQAFVRYPIDKKFRRVTSPFNPKRKHPVTGRVTPHNGTDFATPVGAPVYSTGDGKVIAVRNHPYAGKYLVIEHNSVYKTRYLHLDRFLVKRGQNVKRGQKIALAGATGRITGPHLHFEVLVRNRAVDPMTADLPLATSIDQSERASFMARVSVFDDLVAVEQRASNTKLEAKSDV